MRREQTDPQAGRAEILPADSVEALRGSRVLTVPHHVCSGSAGMSPWDHHSPEHQRLVEIYSVWGSSEADGSLRPNFWRHNPKNSVRSALAKGYRLGIVASGDSHDGHPGNSDWLRVRRGYRNGLVAVYARELTREAVFDALWDRACYGTTGVRILLDVQVNGVRMGKELTSAADRESRRIELSVQGTAPIKDVTIVRNGEEVHTCQGSGEGVAFDWEDTDAFDSVSLEGLDGRPFIYYYVRVIQADGETAWSSPIWVSTGPPSG